MRTLVLMVALVPPVCQSAEHSGRVTFSGAPVPGAVVAAVQGQSEIRTTTDADGVYQLSGLTGGVWLIVVDMTGFATQTREFVAGAGSSHLEWELSLLSIADLQTALTQTKLAIARSGENVVATSEPRQQQQSEAPQPAGSPDLPSRQAPDRELTQDITGTVTEGLLVDGSVNNAAASPFAQPAAFGNNRPRAGAVYSGSLALHAGHSALDARPFSFVGARRGETTYQDYRVVATFGGPIRLPRLESRSVLFLGYQLLRDHNARTQSAIVPTLRERAGDFSQTVDAFGRPLRITDPRTGRAFADAVIPRDRISPQALALMHYYPRPNASAGRFNYEGIELAAVRQDHFQSRVSHRIGSRNQVGANLVYQRDDSDATSIFAFEDRSRRSGLEATLDWTRRLTQQVGARLRYQVNRQAATTLPHFANRIDVGGDASIAGISDAPIDWGPPALVFSTGIESLSDRVSRRDRTTTHAAVVEVYRTRGRHGTTFGGALRRHSLYRAHSVNPRGIFLFDGTASGHDLADFVLGLPHASSLAFSASDRFFTSYSYSSYVSDDYRVGPNLTLNLGVRWDHERPFTERDGELVNLDMAPRFAAVAPVTPALAVGPVTGRRYTASLLSPDYTGVQPRLAATWRPLSGSSLVIRSGYGAYRAIGTYGGIAEALAQQPPFANVRTVTNDGTLLTLADVFASAAEGRATFAVAPQLRVPQAHHWQLSVQRDLPASLTAVATYSGMRAVWLLQQSLPNVSPPGAANPCSTCPAGFVHLSSTGAATRHAAQVRLRRRLRRGFTASAEYTLARSLDDTSYVTAPSTSLAPTITTGAAVAALPGIPGVSIVQDWTMPSGDWGPSSFDQRHVFRAQAEYSSGGGAAGLVRGIRAALVNGWAMAVQLTAGSGLPFTPAYPIAIEGVGTILVRPDALEKTPQQPSGVYAVASSYAIPPAGRWGNARRHSIRGPAQFSLEASLGRDLPFRGRSLEVRIDSTNLLNTVTFGRVMALLQSPQFGHPTLANPMRKLQLSVRLRY